MGTARRRVRSGPVPTPCVQAQCFDLLVRHCVACNLLRTPEPRGAAAAASSQAPGTALQPQESVGASAGLEAALPLPGLLFGAPALLGLALALALVAVVSWKWKQQCKTSAPETPDEGQDAPEPLDNVFIPLESLDTSAPGCSTPREESDSTPQGHSIPVPATELGSTELVTTKTAGPE
uniref:tumor necrosis factor receptor superfamily member 13C n=1 Tax=Jaculus jaculus TaxID=51337 RepID=UPI0003331809|nr:tumor necrosis factor receptor superfamily member 13C [Jaculus jaculus]